MSAAPGEALARATFEAENNVTPVDAADELFRYDDAAQRAIDTQKPWRNDPRYFKQCVRRGCVRADGCVLGPDSVHTSCPAACASLRWRW